MDITNYYRRFSLKRIKSYINIEHEVNPTQSRKPPAAWPASGDLLVDNLSARYSKVELKHRLLYERPSQSISISLVSKSYILFPSILHLDNA